MSGLGVGNPYGSGKPKPKPKPPPTAAQRLAAQKTKTNNQNALTYITGILQQYGLPSSLAKWAWGEIVAGKSQDQVVLDLYDQPAFKQRFPAIFTRQQQGLPPITPADYVNYEDQATQLFQAAGFPPSFYDNPKNFTAYIAQDMSPNELQARLQLAQQAAFSTPPEAQAYLQRHYGITAGDLTANEFLDPKVAEPLLAQKFLAAQIGGSAAQTGYSSDLDTNTANYLAQQGITQSQAAAGFNDLAEKQQLFTGLPGENAAGISESQQIGAEFDQNAQDQQMIAQREQARLSAFHAGGGFASSTGGFGGIGPAGRQ